MSNDMNPSDAKAWRRETAEHIMLGAMSEAHQSEAPDNVTVPNGQHGLDRTARSVLR